MEKKKRVWIFFESAEDRDQTLILIINVGAIIFIISKFAKELANSIDHILSMFLESYVTIVTFYFKSKNGQHSTEDKSDNSENIDEIIRRAKGE